MLLHPILIHLKILKNTLKWIKLTVNGSKNEANKLNGASNDTTEIEI
jgi:hypothetical protein